MPTTDELLTFGSSPEGCEFLCFFLSIGIVGILIILLIVKQTKV